MLQFMWIHVMNRDYSKLYLGNFKFNFKEYLNRFYKNKFILE